MRICLILKVGLHARMSPNLITTLYIYTPLPQLSAIVITFLRDGHGTVRGPRSTYRLHCFRIAETVHEYTKLAKAAVQWSDDLYSSFRFHVKFKLLTSDNFTTTYFTRLPFKQLWPLLSLSPSRVFGFRKNIFAGIAFKINSWEYFTDLVLIKLDMEQV